MDDVDEREWTPHLQAAQALRVSITRRRCQHVAHSVEMLLLVSGDCAEKSAPGLARPPPGRLGSASFDGAEALADLRRAFPAEMRIKQYLRLFAISWVTIRVTLRFKSGDLGR
jgi:hypothetical protein